VLLKLERTSDSDPTVMKQVLDQLRAIEPGAPAEIRGDLQVEIRSGEALANGGTIDPRNPGSLVREGEAASRHLNTWLTTNCR